nr:hypothetical protein [Tanacetum cinerariifolium]
MLESQVCDKFKTGVGYDSQVFDSQVNDKYKTGEGYHAVLPPYTGNFMPPKSDLILADVDEYVVSESVTSVPAIATNEAKTNTECVVLSPDFKLLDESKFLRRVLRKNNMYNVDLKNVDISGGLTCLFAKATLNESNLWHRRLGHINFKAMNKLAGGNIVRGKFDGKANEGFFVGYFMNSKAFRVFNSRTRIVEETLHITFLKNKPNVAGSGPTWLFDIDTLTKSMNYKPVTQDPLVFSSSKDSLGDGFKPSREEEKKDAEDPGKEDFEVLSTKEPRVNQEKDLNVNSTNNINTVSPTANAADIKDNDVDENIVYGCADDPDMPNLEEIVYSNKDKDVSAEDDMTNLDINIPVYPIPTTRIHKDHPVKQIIGDIHSAPQTRRMTKNVTNHALKNLSWIEAMQDELLQFKLQQVWTLVDLPYGKRATRTKWIYKNKKDERGIVVRNKIDMKSAFLYDKIEEEVYIYQPLGFEDPEFPDRVYKVEKALYDLHQAPKAWYETLSAYSLDNGFQRGLQVTQKDGGIFISQDKYVHEILKKFGFSTVKIESTPIETSKPLMKDENDEVVDVHLYRSMVSSLMFLTSSMPDIMFVVCACARFQVTPKVLYLHDVKRIFRYLKGQPKLGLWYPKDSLFTLEAYTNSVYAGASLDRKSTTGGCQFFGSRLISWQCKNQTVVANSTTEAEYVVASSCCGKVLWIQNQMIDYGYNFMNTKIFIDNESTIYIVKNPVFHSKTKHIEIIHHFIRDSYKKRLIQVIKIHTDHNVADLLTKAFDVSRFHYLIANETVHEERRDKVERVATTAASLDAEHDSGTINKTQATTIPNEPIPQSQEVGKEEKVKNSITQEEVIQSQESLLLKKSLDDQKGASNQKRNDQDEGISFVQDVEIQRRYGHDIEINTASTSITTSNINITIVEPVTTISTPITTDGVSVSTAKPSTPLTTTTTTVIKAEDLTIAQTLMKIRNKGKGKMVKPEKPLKKKDQIEFDKEVAQRLQAQLQVELEEEERMARQKEEDANIAEWDDIQVMMDADHELAKRLQAEDAMLDDFDRQDVLDLYRLVKERFETTSLEGYDRFLWGDLMTLFKPSKEDEIWKNQQDYTLISWIYDSCGIHLLLMDTGMSIHILGRIVGIKRLFSAVEVTAASYEVTTAGYGFYCW